RSRARARSTRVSRGKGSQGSPQGGSAARQHQESATSPHRVHLGEHHASHGTIEHLGQGLTGLSEPASHSYPNRTPEVGYLISITPQARSACCHCLSAEDTVFLNEDLGEERYPSGIAVHALPTIRLGSAVPFSRPTSGGRECATWSRAPAGSPRATPR